MGSMLLPLFCNRKILCYGFPSYYFSILFLYNDLHICLLSTQTNSSLLSQQQSANSIKHKAVYCGSSIIQQNTFTFLLQIISLFPTKYSVFIALHTRTHARTHTHTHPPQAGWLACSSEPKSYTSRSGGTGRDALAGQVKGEEPD